MNEQELFKTIIRNQIIDDDLVKRSAKAEAPKRKNTFARILTPVLTAAASLAVLFTVTMMIPSARAEVLSWLDPTGARDYVSADPGEREPVSELDAMITGAEQNRTEIQVNYVADEPYWREIGESFSATLGETIFDGRDIYLTIDFNGLSGYPVFENEWCPSLPAGALPPTLLAEKLDPEMVKLSRDDFADVSLYLNGVLEQWNGPDNFLILTFEDGTELYGWMEQVSRPVDESFRQAFHDRYGFHESYDEETALAWRDMCWAHCKENGARAVANFDIPNGEAERFYPDNGKTLADYIDENGYITLHARYQVSIDHGEETETKLDVDLGTVKVDMTAYKDMKKRYIEMPQDAVTLSGEATFGVITFNEQYRARAANYSGNLDGVTLRVIAPGVVDLFGVHDIEILVTMPDDWSEEMKYAFARNLAFDVLVDDDLIVNFGGSIKCNDNGSYTLNLSIVDTIPIKRINSMQTITLTPSIQWFLEAKISRFLPDGTLETVKIVPIEPDGFFDEATLEPGTPVGYGGNNRDFPEYAIVLKVN